jgi:hypothetical protein
MLFADGLSDGLADVGITEPCSQGIDLLGGKHFMECRSVPDAQKGGWQPEFLEAERLRLHFVRHQDPPRFGETALLRVEISHEVLI